MCPVGEPKVAVTRVNRYPRRKSTTRPSTASLWARRRNCPCERSVRGNRMYSCSSDSFPYLLPNYVGSGLSVPGRVFGRVSGCSPREHRRRPEADAPSILPAPHIACAAVRTAFRVKVASCLSAIPRRRGLDFEESKFGIKIAIISAEWSHEFL